MSDTTDDVTVLMTGAGAPGASGILTSLRRAGEYDVTVVGVDMNPDAYGFALVDESHTVPAGDDEAYVPRMRDVASAAGADVVLPLTTPELQPLAEHRDSFEATVMVSEPDRLAIANDKGRLYEFLADAGLDAAPRFRRVETLAGLADAVADFGYPEEPVCFKPPVASGRRGFRVLDARADRPERLLTEKPDSAVTTLEDVRAVLEEAEAFPELVVMEYLPGEEFSVDALGMGETVGPVVPRSRERTRAGISFEGTVQKRPELIDATRDICERLGLEYNVNVQFRYDGEGTPKVIEINPRVSGTVVMCVGAGANLPHLALRYALGDSVPAVDVEWGTRMVRYWQEAFQTPDGTTFHLDTGS